MYTRKLAVIVLLVSPVAIGDGGVDDGSPEPGLQTVPLKPLDARVEDVGVLSTSLRVESSGLGVPSGFDAVYRVPGDADKLMRVNGALFAVFDQSVYQTGAAGTTAVVPPSTVFHIGVPPETVLAGVDSSRSGPSVPVESVRSDRIGFGTVPPATPDRVSEGRVPSSKSSDPLPRFVTDVEYRARRLAEILESHLAR